MWGVFPKSKLQSIRISDISYKTLSNSTVNVWDPNWQNPNYICQNPNARDFSFQKIFRSFKPKASPSNSVYVLVPVRFGNLELGFQTLHQNWKCKGVQFSDNFLVFQTESKSFELCLCTCPSSVWQFRVRISDIAPKSECLETECYLEHWNPN